MINGVLYTVGGDSSATFAYDLLSGSWDPTLPVRPFSGDHHSAEVIDAKLYLFGGLSGGSEGKVQIFDPATAQWTLGQDIPFATASPSTALIDGLVYLAGGIVDGDTSNQTAVYDPQSDQWTELTPMPLGRNHTAAGTDGEKLYIFGGRDGDNIVTEGFDEVQIYDPVSDTWDSSHFQNSPIPPLPQKRGGMGKAAFFRGEFYVIGGETTPDGFGAEPGDVYNRVDVFDPISMSWREEAVLPTPRHGIFPIAYNGELYLAGGGTAAGFAPSTVFEIFSR